MLAASLALVAGTLAPLALDGEAAVERGPSGPAIAIVSIVSIGVGYLVLFLLWRYVFSAKARAKRGEPPD
ncbi:MAG TPA: hypothetical protein VMG62_04800 [Solirubrobacteraceae bacterium]|nr:hypothetical protein [Solirubrobacteraceae bacterium]